MSKHLSAVRSLRRIENNHRSDAPFGTSQCALMITAIVIGAILQSGSPERLIDIEPGNYSFKELATKLSDSDREVTCQPAMSWRCAFVRFKHRTAKQAFDCLRRGLGIDFLVSANGRQVKMIPDPIVVQRELNCRTKLATSLAASFAEYGKPYQQLTSPLKDDPSSLEEGSWMEQLRKAIQAKDAASERNARVRLRQASARRDVGWVGGLVCAEAGSFVPASAFESAMAPRTALDVLFFPELPTSTQFTIGTDIDLVDALVVCRLYAGRQEDSLFFDYAMLVDGPAGERTYSFSGGIQLPDLTGYAFPRDLDEANLALARMPHDTISTLYNGAAKGSVFEHSGFGRGATEWLAEKMQATNEFLATDAAKSKVNLGEGTCDSLSQILARWSKATDTDVVMELSPRAEGRSYNFTRLASRQFSWSTTVNPTAHWSFESVNGALIVTDLLSFMDRSRTTPLSTLVACERRRTVAESAPTLEELDACLPAGSLASIGRFQRNLTATYHGFHLEEFDDALDAAALYRSLTAAQRTEVDKLQPNQRIHVPFMALSLDEPARRDLLLRFNGKRSGNIFCLNRSTRGVLDGLELTVWCDPDSVPSGRKLGFSVQNRLFNSNRNGAGLRCEVHSRLRIKEEFEASNASG